MRRLCLSLYFVTFASASALAYNENHPTLYDDFIARQAQKHGVPERLVHRIVQRESRYNPRVTHNACFGLMQIKIGTARSMGYKGDARGLLDPHVNMTYAIPYLSNAYRVAGGDEDRAVQLFAAGYYFTAKNKQMLSELRTAESPPLTPEPAAPPAPEPPKTSVSGLLAFLGGAPSQPAPRTDYPQGSAVAAIAAASPAAAPQTADAQTVSAGAAPGQAAATAASAASTAPAQDAQAQAQAAQISSTTAAPAEEPAPDHQPAKTHRDGKKASAKTATKMAAKAVKQPDSARTVETVPAPKRQMALANSQPSAALSPSTPSNATPTALPGASTEENAPLPPARPAAERKLPAKHAGAKTAPHTPTKAAAPAIDVASTESTEAQPAATPKHAAPHRASHAKSKAPSTSGHVAVAAVDPRAPAETRDDAASK
ncbi:Lytic transglycosylase catalytic [Methylocella silvestris BL2]|uniref:Lytic transglycosylase catalytic n=1 Tax=Methylocella silvestris (strain DSM 15510 / CIP 108128 / LMG 27833 / NCIMB 13906 / BL2) TaxID=395965 RepID=B8EIV8_METSB|nr:lytic transglycosylase domain-containing protein [Methylocella silvestris]ACK52450.1 Lytic transglycosylase catalytic [Methylocella silvestris BL2]